MTSQTMPLPAAQSQARNLRNLIILTLGGALAGAAAGYFIGHALKSSGLAHKINPWVLLLSVPLGWLLSVALHETGHVAGGLICGFRFYLFAAGPLRIERDGERLRVTFNRIPALWGGIAACMPRTFGPQLRRQMLLLTAAGPLFSVLGALLLMPAMSLRTSYLSISVFLTVFAFMSAVLALATLLPTRLHGFNSDGARILMLLQNATEGRRWIALASVTGLAALERPRDWPAELLNLLGDGSDSSPDAVNVCLLRHIWHLDRRAWEPARLWLERGLSNIDFLPKPMRGRLHAAAAGFYARPGNDAALALHYLNLAIQPGLHNPKEMHLIVASVLIAEGRTQEALAELDLAAATVKSKPPHLAAALEEDLDELRAAARCQGIL